MSRFPLAGLVYLLVTYVVWGSTYLAIRVAVRAGAGWGPFWLGASRTLVAFALLLALATLLRRRAWPSRSDLGVIAASGLLLWVGGNGGVLWAERTVDSGLVALVVGTIPMWVAAMEALLDRRPPSVMLVISIAAGFAGLTVLVAPLLRDGVAGDAAGVGLVLLGSMCWGGGSILMNRRPPATAPMVTSAWQHLAGAAGFLALVALSGEGPPHPTPEAWGAWAYLVVFGSVLAFTSYVAALRLLPASIVMTSTYVNPVIAVLLGWLILDERITVATVVAMGLIIVGVFGTFQDRRSRSATPDHQDGT